MHRTKRQGLFHIYLPFLYLPLNGHCLCSNVGLFAITGDANAEIGTSIETPHVTYYILSMERYEQV